MRRSEEGVAPPTSLQLDHGPMKLYKTPNLDPQPHYTAILVHFVSFSDERDRVPDLYYTPSPSVFGSSAAA